jgi:superfamily II DNA/RNA helicase
MPSWLLNRCTDLGFNEPTPAQRVALPSILSGRDVVLQSQTGSGKTLAYALPLIAKIDTSRAAIQAVIVVPTRELGLQVSSLVRQLTTGSPERILTMSVIDGSKNRRQQLWAVAEPPHIVVGNPSSLLRLVDMNRLRLNAVDFIVLDEVDASLLHLDTKSKLHLLLSRHLSSSFLQAEEEDTEKSAVIEKNSLVYTDKAKNARDVESKQYTLKRQTVMCSATIPQRQYFASQCFQRGWTDTLPELIYLSASQLVPESLSHEFVSCAVEKRAALTSYLINAEHKASESTSEHGFQCIIFVNNDKEMGQIIDSIQKRNSKNPSDALQVDMLHKGMGLEERAQALQAYRDGDTAVLICAELLARGIDVVTTTHVIHYGIPESVDEYVHRAGRAGRLGRSGKVITIVSEEENFVVRRFSNSLGVQIKERIVTVRNKRHNHNDGTER